MIRNSLCILAACTLVSSIAQAQIVTFGADSQRESSALFYWDRGAKKLVGGIEVSYGAPKWKAEYSKVVDSGKEGGMRLGKDGWARLINDVPVKMGGVKIPRGSWCLGLARTESGFQLMVMNAATIQKLKIPSWETGKVGAKINVPLTHSKVEESSEKLSIKLVGNKQDVAKPTFLIHWGPHQLKAAVHANLKPKKAKKAKKEHKGEHGGEHK